MSSALVLFAHGSRDPQWAAPFRAVQQRVAARRPEIAVELAFLELMEPSLPQVVQHLVDQKRTHIAIAPMFMAQGAHLKRDLAGLMTELSGRYPDLHLELLPAAGEVESVVDAMSTWLVANC